MNDINFDELDAAVNSALQKNTQDTVTDTPQPSPAAPIVDDAVQLPEQQSAAVVKAKRRGQFMDMVHPSSDMTRSDAASTLPPARRQSSQIEPLRRDVMEGASDSGATPAAAPDLTVPTIPVTPLAQQIDSSEEDTEDISNDELSTEAESQDPISSAQMVDVPVIPAAPSPEQVAAVTAAEGVFATAPAEPSDPVTPQPQPEELQSTFSEPLNPFIEGAAVEKRPLGAFAENSTQPEGESVPDPYTSEAYAPQNEETIPEAEATQEVVGQPLVSGEVSQQPISGSSTPVSAEMTGVDTTHEAAFAQSIPQQYQTAVTDVAEETVGNVLAAEQYQTPLPVQKAKSHVVLYVLLAVVMVAIGAVAAYAIFVLKLI